MPPMHAAERGPQIELGEPRRRRPPAIDLAMTGEREQEERHQVERDRREPEDAVAAEQPIASGATRNGTILQHQIVREPRRSRKTATKVSR